MQKTPSLTPRQSDKLMHLLVTAPITEYEYFANLEAERNGEGSTLRSAILKRGKGFEVWIDDTESDVAFEGVFPTEADAMEAEQEAMVGRVESINTALEAMRDEEWAAMAVDDIEWEYPMTFTDATDFRWGFELLDGEEVQTFLEGPRACIFEPDVPGSIYWWSLTDANDVPCRPVRSHRGEIKLMAASECVE